MSWIDRALLKCIRVYLFLVFSTFVTLFAFLRRVSGRSPIAIARRQRTSYWVRRKNSAPSGAGLITTQPRGRSLFGTTVRRLLSEGKYDYAVILALLLPVKAFLRVDKSTEVDPSIYVMY
jgi:hypothetical protein